MSAIAMKPANAERIYPVKRADLPVCCPQPDQMLWNAHPRVYLPLHEQSEARCMYCGAVYRLID